MNACVALVSSSLPRASTFAPVVDRSLQIVAWFTVFLCVVTAGGLLLFLLFNREAASAEGAGTPGGRRFVSYLAIGVCLLLGAFFVQGAFAWADMQVVPRGAQQIKVATGEKGFTFTYPNGHVANELHLAVDRPVKFTFRGEREPYGFSVPAFRLQVDVAPHSDRTAWVEPTLAGEYDVRSIARPTARATGLSATVVVHEEAAFDKWYQDISGPPLDLPPIELGQRSYQMRGCTQCHTIDGSKLVGPSFKGFLAQARRLKDGTVVEPTDDYIKESIIESQAKVLDGYEPVMPSFKGRLHELEVAGLVAYLKSLQ